MHLVPGNGNISFTEGAGNGSLGFRFKRCSVLFFCSPSARVFVAVLCKNDGIYHAMIKNESSSVKTCQYYDHRWANRVMHDLANPANSQKNEGNFSYYDVYLFITFKCSHPSITHFWVFARLFSFTVMPTRKAKGATVIQINWPLALPSLPVTPPPHPKHTLSNTPLSKRGLSGWVF